MEGNIVLGHELVELHIFRVLPPFLPLLSVARRDREITDKKRLCCILNNYYYHTKDYIIALKLKKTT